MTKPLDINIKYIYISISMADRLTDQINYILKIEAVYREKQPTNRQKNISN